MRSTIPILRADPSISDIASQIEFDIEGAPSSNSRTIKFRTDNTEIQSYVDNQKAELCVILECASTATIQLLIPQSDGIITLPADNLANQFELTPVIRAKKPITNYSNQYHSIAKGISFNVLAGQFLAVGESIPYNDAESWWKLKGHDDQDWIYQTNPSESQVVQFIPMPVFNAYQQAEPRPLEVMTNILKNKVIGYLTLQMDILDPKKMLYAWVTKNVLDGKITTLPDDPNDRIRLVDSKFPPIL